MDNMLRCQHSNDAACVSRLYDNCQQWGRNCNTTSPQNGKRRRITLDNKVWRHKIRHHPTMTTTAEQTIGTNPINSE